MPVMYRKAASKLSVVRDYHYSNILQEAVWLPPESHSISLAFLMLDNKQILVGSHIMHAPIHTYIHIILCCTAYNANTIHENTSLTV